MRQLFSQKLDRIIKEKEFPFNFQIDKTGIYGIEITASSKSWWQNLIKLRSFFKDDDLILKIDNLEFPKKGLKQRRLFDSEVAFNGNNLQGKKKTDLFLIKLDKGTHLLTFLADQKPKIHSIRIYQIDKSEKGENLIFQHSQECWNINYLPQDNHPLEDENRRQWLTIILVNLGLKNLKIKASAKQGKSFLFFKRDDADLKLIINNQIQKNQEPKSHKNWYWCGRTLKGREKTFEKELNLPPSIHYIELWADRSPEVREIKIGIGIEKSSPCPIFTLKDIQGYTFRGINENEDFNRFDREILEAVNFWNKFFFSQKYPPKEPLNPNLVKAMIYVESRMGYAKPPPRYYPSYPDVIQIGDPRNPAIHTLREEEGYFGNEYVSDTEISHLSYSFPKKWLPVKIERPFESIFWGVRWLYHKAQHLRTDESGKVIYPYQRRWFSWQKAVKRYNSREKYQEEVLNIYKKGVDPDGNKLWKVESLNPGNVKIVALLLVSFLFLIVISIFLFPHKIFTTKSLIKEINSALISTPQYFKIIQKIPLLDEKNSIGILESELNVAKGIVVLNKKGKVIDIFPLPTENKNIFTWEENWSLGEYLNWIKVEDLNKDKTIEVASEMINSGSALARPFYLYQLENKKPKLILYLDDAVSETQLKDFNQDGIFEILHSFSLDGTGLSGRMLTKWKEVWAWDGKKYKKANNLYPQIYSDLIKEYEQTLKNPPDEEAMIHYRPIIKCLLKKAKQNQKGIFADGQDCLKFE